jgi:hypothetical protein
MSSRAFFLLFLACLAFNLGARFGFAALVEVAAKAEVVVAASREPGMALPPKPEGMEKVGEGVGDGQGGQGIITVERCIENYDESRRDVCFHAAARQIAARDPAGAIPICDRLKAEELRWECHADVAEAAAPVDRNAADAICVGIPIVKWRGQCNFGMGLALAEIDAAFAFERCEKAEIFRDFCRHDVVGEIALVDFESAIALCAKEEGDTLTRKTCWHGIGKYLARRDVNEAAESCRRTTESWRTNCYHGLGWGAAERDPDAAVAACDTYGVYRDNCRQGVAHQQKRSDPSRAVALCESIESAETKIRCLNFVRG